MKPALSSRGLRRVALFSALASGGPALAQTMVGQGLLTWSSNYIIGPLGIISVVLALAASVFRPDLVRGAVYSAVICAVLFFVVRFAPQLTQAMQQ